jgi:hypothetical protein
MAAYGKGLSAIDELKMFFFHTRVECWVDGAIVGKNSHACIYKEYSGLLRFHIFISFNRHLLMLFFEKANTHIISFMMFYFCLFTFISYYT